jgi:hypothetical protein
VIPISAALIVLAESLYLADLVAARGPPRPPAGASLADGTH